MKKTIDIKVLNFIIILCEIWKGICPFLGFAYLFTWLLQFRDEEWYEILNNIFGLLPNLINAMFPYQTDLFRMEVPMGHIYSAALVIISLYVTMKIQIRVIDYKRKIQILENEQQNRQLKKAAKERIDTRVNNLNKLTYFFGVLDLRLSTNETTNKTNEKLALLKNEYLKMIHQKLCAKYPNVQFEVSDEIFIVSDDFLIFDPFLLDITKFFKIFSELGNQKNIKTDLLLSFNCGSANNSLQYVKKVLIKVNELRHFNRVIVINKFAEKYKVFKAGHFDLYPLGISKIEMENFNEMDVDLHYLKKKKII